MITIRITNAEEVVRNQKGWFVAAIGDMFLDLDDKVEEVVVEKVRAALAENGVEAVIERRPHPAAAGD